MFVCTIDQAKGMFFDRKKVQAATDRAARGALIRFGAYTRRTARQSIRRRKRASKPGQPPSSHTGDLRRIFFGFDPGRQSVVIGPVLLGGKIGRAPRTLEEGGRSKARIRRRGRKVVRPIRIQARPFMGPAFKRELPRAAPLLQGSVRG